MVDTKESDCIREGGVWGVLLQRAWHGRAHLGQLVALCTCLDGVTDIQACVLRVSRRVNSVMALVDTIVAHSRCNTPFN